MENNATIKDFLIELEDTKSGHEKLSCIVNNKHYVGFLMKKEKKVKAKTTLGYYYESKYYKLTKMSICDWLDCQVCSSL